MGKIRILHMTPPDVKNGVHKYIFNHLPYIDRNRFEFAFLTKSAKDIMLTDEYKKYCFKLYTLHHTERENKEGLCTEVENILNEGYDAIHLHTSSWRGFFIEEVAMSVGMGQVIVHSHSTGIDEIDPTERKDRIDTHEKYKEKFSMKYATDVAACSRLAGDWLYGSQIPRDKIRILPNAINVEKYQFSPAKRKELRSDMGLEDRIIVGNVGRYCYQKNQEFLLRAFAESHKKNNKLFLLCVGQGDGKKDLEALAGQLGIDHYVILLDWQDHVEDYLQMMDVFCLPSHFEGLPISVVEAQAAGLRCLISDSVTREVGITPLTEFLPLSKELWADAMAESKKDDKRENFNAMITDAGYNIKFAARRLEELYLEGIGGNR